MARTATKTRKAPAKAKAAQKRGAPKGPREPIEVPTKATFDTDDKRAQYARLVVFNYAKSAKSKAKVGKGMTVNDVPNSVLNQAGLELAGGTILKGPEGLDFIIEHTKAGATDAKVAERGLTKAYAAEVRPFLRRLKLAPAFGRRGSSKKEAPAEEPVVEEEVVAEEE